MHVSKSAILAIFRQGQDGRALLVQPSRIPHRISKILFAVGVDEFLAMLKVKTREAPLFKVQSGKIKVREAIHVTVKNVCSLGVTSEESNYHGSKAKFF